MQSSRQRILAYLLRHPGSSVDVLAQEVGLAPMTTRQHLIRMEAEGLVQTAREHRPTGRPAHVYSLTPKGDAEFPKAYDRLAGLLFAELLQGGDRPESACADALLARLAARAAAPHVKRLEGLRGWDRARAAAAILAEESGGMEVEEATACLELRDFNCIYRRVAETYGSVCQFHTALVSRLMGQPVELVESQCEGAVACCFRVQVLD